MPIYEYDCAICKDRFEKLVRNPNPTEVQCPSCGSKEVVRRFSVFGMKSTGSFSPSTSSESAGSCSGGGCGNCGCH